VESWRSKQRAQKYEEQRSGESERATRECEKKSTESCRSFVHKNVSLKLVGAVPDLRLTALLILSVKRWRSPGVGPLIASKGEATHVRAAVRPKNQNTNFAVS
jgi:hypothetical protein